jgi:macrolide-specific efflux system membrane fusion protein
MTQFTTTSRPRRWLSLLLWVVVLGCLLGAAAYWWLLVENDESQDWLVEPLRYGDIEQSVAATGTLEPKNYVEVGAQVSGQIKHLMVEEGEVVKKGQLLAEIDASVFELNVQTAEPGWKT